MNSLPREATPADMPSAARLLTPQELLAGSQLQHEVEIPAAVLRPGQPDPSHESENTTRHIVRLRPLKVATLALISRAAQDDAALVPLLMVKESLVEPQLGFDEIRSLHAGLVQFLVAAVHRISGMQADGEAVRVAGDSAIGEAHLRLARHYGWTPSQVAELTPGQMAVYLSALPGPGGQL